ncbi:MAG: 2-hydroxyacid dehydrogenase [Hyphomicrobiaceae bacterium]
MTSPDILIASRVPPASLAHLEENFNCHKLYEADDRDAFLGPLKDKIRGVVTTGLRGYDRALLEALPKLEMISIHGAGLQACDLQAAKDHNVIVTNTPDNSKIAVAELAIALMLAAARRVSESDAFVKSGEWASRSFGKTGTGLYGKACGVVALGTIGRAVADRASAFGMDVAYFGPRKKSDAPYRYVSDVTELARDSDFLILCCPELPETRGLITADVLNALGADGILINVSRAIVTDEPALIKALQDGTIKAAGLDVFMNEPNIAAEFLELSNAVLVPHIGTATSDIMKIRKELTVANLKAFFDGSDVTNLAK